MATLRATPIQFQRTPTKKRRARGFSRTGGLSSGVSDNYLESSARRGAGDNDGLRIRVIVPILLAFVAIAVLCAHTNLPWSDEAWFASPALNLITNGSFGTSVLDPTASFRTNNLTGIRQHTYWIVPLFPLAEAAWFRVMGFGLMQLRYLSIL